MPPFDLYGLVRFWVTLSHFYNNYKNDSWYKPKIFSPCCLWSNILVHFTYWCLRKNDLSLNWFLINIFFRYILPFYPLLRGGQWIFVWNPKKYLCDISQENIYHSVRYFCMEKGKEFNKQEYANRIELGLHV